MIDIPKDPNEQKLSKDCSFDHLPDDPRLLTPEDIERLERELGFPYKTAFEQDKDGNISWIIMDEDINRTRKVDN